MGTQPDFNRTDPWTLAQKFIDNQNKEYSNLQYMTHQLNMKAGANERDTAEESMKPQRRYNETRALGQAGIDNTKEAEAAGIDTAGGSRYRKTKTGPNDPEIFNEFMEGVKEKGLTNPYGLAVVAGTGQVESGFSKGNLHRKWSDPSEKGVAGTSGLLMSWRDDRLRKALEYGKQNGEDMPSARTQGRFLADENPQMIQELQNAGSLAEAQKIINRNWKFAGWDTGGGSSKARLDASAAYLKQFGANPMTAKERSTSGTQLAQQATSAASTPLVDENGKEYFEIQMDADGYKKVANGIPNGRGLIVPDTTKPLGPKGQMTVRQYTGKSSTPAAVPASITPPPKAQTAEVPKARGYDGTEDEL